MFRDVEDRQRVAGGERGRGRGRGRVSEARGPAGRMRMAEAYRSTCSPSAMVESVSASASASPAPLHPKPSLTHSHSPHPRTFSLSSTSLGTSLLSRTSCASTRQSTSTPPLPPRPGRKPRLSLDSPAVPPPDSQRCAHEGTTCTAARTDHVDVPQVEELVMVQVKQIQEMGAYVKLVSTSLDLSCEVSGP